MKTLVIAFVLAGGMSSAAFADEEWIFAKAGGQVLGYDTHSGSSGDLITGAKIIRLKADGAQPKVALQKFQVDCRNGQFQAAGTVALGPNGAMVQEASATTSGVWEPIGSDKAVEAFHGLFCGE